MTMRNIKSENMIHGALIVAFCTVVFVVQNEVNWKNLPMDDPEYDLYYIPDSKYLTFMSGGFNEFVADMYWIQTVLYFGKRAVDDSDSLIADTRLKNLPETQDFFQVLNENRKKYKHLYALTKMVNDLDPYFSYPYIFGGLFLSLKADEADLSIEILKKGMVYDPDNWAIPNLLGFNYYFFKNDGEKAAEYFQTAGRLPGCPPYIINMAQAVLVQQGKKDAAIEFLRGIQGSAQNKALQPEIEKILKRLTDKS